MATAWDDRATTGAGAPTAPSAVWLPQEPILGPPPPPEVLAADAAPLAGPAAAHRPAAPAAPAAYPGVAPLAHPLAADRFTTVPAAVAAWAPWAGGSAQPEGPVAASAAAAGYPVGTSSRHEAWVGSAPNRAWADGDDHRQNAVISLVLGLGLLVVAGAVLQLTLSTGLGRVWTWGFVAGGLFVGRAVWSYARAVRAGTGHVGVLGWALVGGGVLVAVLVVVTSLRAAYGPVDVGVGDCFTDEGPAVQVVACSQPHQYVAVDVVTRVNDCPASANVFTRLGDGELACLAPAVPGGD